MKNKKSPIKVIALPKAKAPADAASMIAALMSLQVSEGWALILANLDANIKYLELAILDKSDPETKQPLTDTEIEALRYKRTLNIELRDTPDNFIKTLKEEMVKGEVNFDPYDNAEEMRARRHSKT